MKYDLSEDHFLFMKFISGNGKTVQEFYAYNPPNKIWSENQHTEMYMELFDADVIDKKTFRQKGNVFHHDIMKLNEAGELLLSNYIKQKEREDEEKELQFKKLRYDVKNAERIYKSYPLTRIAAWIGAITGSILLIRQLIEWYNKLR